MCECELLLEKDRPVLRVDEADVSVLIPTYRRGSCIESTVRSALSTGAGEVIVSDDASDDDTVEALRRIVDPRLLIVVQPRAAEPLAQPQGGPAAGDAPLDQVPSGR